MSSTSPMGVTLDPRKRTLSTRLTVWSIAAKHVRAGGDVDVILGTRAKGSRDVRYLAFRRDQGEWTQLAGMWPSLKTAAKEVPSRVKKQVFTATYVKPLLDIAAELPDFTAEEKS